MNARHRHLVRERHFALIHGAGDRRGGGRLGRGRERNVPLAGEQSGSRIQPDPSRARQIHFGPGVQIGEILARARLAFERLHVGLQLDQVAGDEARRESQMTQDLHQQPGAVAARSASERQGLFARLHARLHANQVPDLVLQLLVQVDQKIDGTPLGSDRSVFRYAASLGPAGRTCAETAPARARARAHNRTEISRRTAPGKSRTD